jgi:hypothetical protein
MDIERKQGVPAPLEFSRDDVTANWINPLTSLFGIETLYYSQKPLETPNARTEVAVYYLPSADLNVQSGETILTIVHDPLSEEAFYKVDVCKIISQEESDVIKEVEIEKLVVNTTSQNVTFYDSTQEEPVLTIHSSGLIEHSPASVES